MTVNVQSFSSLMALFPDGKKPRPQILMGNGFSRACMDKVFSYDSLHDRADWKRLSAAGREAFGALETTDFEAVMRALRSAAKLMKAYSVSGAIEKQLIDDADALREILAETIAKNHPEHPFEIDEKKYLACRTFLANFETYLHGQLRPSSLLGAHAHGDWRSRAQV